MQTDQQIFSRLVCLFKNNINLWKFGKQSAYRAAWQVFAAWQQIFFLAFLLALTLLPPKNAGRVRSLRELFEKCAKYILQTLRRLLLRPHTCNSRLLTDNLLRPDWDERFQVNLWVLCCSTSQNLRRFSKAKCISNRSMLNIWKENARIFRFSSISVKWTARPMS